MKYPINARQRAFLACLRAYSDQGYVHNFLDELQKQAPIKKEDAALALYLAAGTITHTLTLDYFSCQLPFISKKLTKLKEKTLLRLLLFEYIYISKTPSYALVNEYVHCAKHQISQAFSRFINAIARQLTPDLFKVPTGKTKDVLSVKYSLPESFIKNILDHYPEEKAFSIFQNCNEIGSYTARQRGIFPPSLEVISPEKPFDFYIENKNYYIQNKTPALLIGHLFQKMPHPPNKILDLCASPGGKIVHLTELYPNATFFANDISEEKLKKLRENLDKFNISCSVSCIRGEDYPLHSSPFDLVVIDAPCSNTGVLHKRPEARLRLYPDHLKMTLYQQQRLLNHAYDLIGPQGVLWYMTCSILVEENQDQVIQICQKKTDLKLMSEILFLPDSQENQDGGYGALLFKKGIG